MNFKFNKNAQIGTTLISLFTFIIIVLILVVFIISSTFITKTGRVGPGEVGVMDEENLGIRDVVFYPYENYQNLVKIREGISKGENVKDIISGGFER